MIYRNTQAVYEFKLQPSLADTTYNGTDYGGVFLNHSDTTIDTKAYNATDIFKVSEIDLGIFYRAY
jgi:hypothetical protein